MASAAELNESPPRRRASKLRTAGMWIFLAAFCLLAIIEWHSRKHFRSAFAAIGGELSAHGGNFREVENVILRLSEAEKLVSGWPLTQTIEHESDRLIGYQWPSLLNSYRLSLRVTRHDRVIQLHLGAPQEMLAQPTAVAVASATTPVPKPVAKSAPVAPQPRPQAPPMWVSNLSEELKQAFTRAQQFLTKGQSKSDEFHELLQSIANDLPRIDLSTKPDEVVWNQLGIFKDAIQFSAFRFSSPLDGPADLYWSFCMDEAELNWNILPVTGRMQGFNFRRRIDHAPFVERTAPDCRFNFMQSLPDGQIQPGQDYIIWFARSGSSYVSPDQAALNQTLKAKAESANPAQFNYFEQTLRARIQRENAEGIPLWCALRLLPADSVPATNSPIQIAKHLGAALYATANSQIVYQGENEIVHAVHVPHTQDIVFCDGTSTIRVVPLNGQAAIRELTGNTNYHRVAVSPGGKRLAAWHSYSTEISLWDLERGESVSPTRPSTSDAESRQMVFGRFSFVGDSQHLFAFRFIPDVFGSNARHDCVLWDIADENATRRIQHGAELRNALLTSDGRPLLAIYEASADPKSSINRPIELRLRTWDDNAEVLKIPLGTGWFPGNVLLSLSPDDKLAGIHASRGGIAEFLLVDLEQKAIVNTFVTNVGAEGGLEAVAWSHDANTLALAQRDGSIRLWNIAANYRGRVWRGHVQTITSLQFIDEGKSVISTSRDGTIRRWSNTDTPCDTFTDSLGLQLVPICAGEFTMGTPPGHMTGFTTANNSIERPRHRVQISKPFYLGKYEVTVKQFRAFVDATGYKTHAEATGDGGYHLIPGQRKSTQSKEYTWRTPGFPQDEDHPVVQVTWDDAQAYCKWLSDQQHAVYRLPTEAEWEYACRAGQDREMWNMQAPNIIEKREDTFGNIADQSHFRLPGNNPGAGGHDDGFPWTAPVGKIAANGFGLCDMHGNVYEWCQDFYDPEYYRFSPPIDPPGPESGTQRVTRGGSFYNDAERTRSNYRDSSPPQEPASHVGFRIVREMADSGS